MGVLNKSIKSIKSKIPKAVGSVNETLFAPTAIDILDYNCGTLATGEDGDTFYNLGIPMGKIHIAVGHSQSGKTTLLLQMANNMVANLNGDVVLADFERATNDPRTRIKNICKVTDEEYDERFTIFNQETMTLEFIKKFIFDVVEAKKALPNSEMVDWVDLQGVECKIYPPTVIIIDSISAVRPKELLDTPDMDGNMVAATVAKGNSAFLASIEHFLEPYNITLMGVGHITTRIQINPYAPKKIQLPGLGVTYSSPC